MARDNFGSGPLLESGISVSFILFSGAVPGTESICQKFLEACRKSTATRVLPSCDSIERATRHCKSSFVRRFVTIHSCDEFTFDESGISPPTALTFRVSEFSEKGGQPASRTRIQAWQALHDSRDVCHFASRWVECADVALTNAGWQPRATRQEHDCRQSTKYNCLSCRAWV